MEKLKKDLLALLQEDARFSYEKLAKMTSTTKEQVEDAVAALEADGIIVGYTTVLNSDLLEEEKVQALIEVRVTPQRNKGFDAIAEEVIKFDEVESVYLMSGGYDLTVVVNGKNLKEVAMFVSERLSTLDDVISTTTHFILKKYKLNGKLLEEKIDNRIVVNP
ncbi:MAG: Lrp/AsnC family transcriptional regulator [Clostridia bacterium]|nr:Lrp/AsnC family transcriptional regulator [Clostridia bacterium]